MDTARVDLLTRYPVPRHRLTRSDYHRMGEAGILGENDRVELLDGQLVDMSPIGPRHALVIDALNELLVTAFAGRARVRVQNPVVLDDGSEPQPDLALLRWPWRGHPQSHPEPDGIFLLIEVSDSSLNFDRRVKLPLYARAGVREVWIRSLSWNESRPGLGGAHPEHPATRYADMPQLSAGPAICMRLRIQSAANGRRANGG